MSTNPTTMTIKMADLENLIRRVVREVVREELARQSHSTYLVEDWSHEGPDDPSGDEQVLRESLMVLEEYGARPETWTKWEDFEAELDKAEGAGDLSD
jgi:hypothetical protein